MTTAKGGVDGDAAAFLGIAGVRCRSNPCLASILEGSLHPSSLPSFAPWACEQRPPRFRPVPVPRRQLILDFSPHTAQPCAV